MRLIQREVRRAVRPGRHPQPPAQRKVLAHRTNPGIRQRVADGLGNGIDAPLLCGLVGVIEIEFVAKFVERHNMDYLVMALDQKDAAKTLTAYGVNAIPEVVLIDRQGIVRQVIVGGGTEKIDEEVAKLLAERP